MAACKCQMIAVDDPFHLFAALA